MKGSIEIRSSADSFCVSIIYSFSSFCITFPINIVTADSSAVQCGGLEAASGVSFFHTAFLSGRMCPDRILFKPLYRKFANAVMIAALKKSMNRDPTSGTIMNATGAGPYWFVIACMFAIAFGVAPIPNPQKPEEMVAAS